MSNKIENKIKSLFDTLTLENLTLAKNLCISQDRTDIWKRFTEPYFQLYRYLCHYSWTQPYSTSNIIFKERDIECILSITNQKILHLGAKVKSLHYQMPLLKNLIKIHIGDIIINRKTVSILKKMPNLESIDYFFSKQTSYLEIARKKIPLAY